MKCHRHVKLIPAGNKILEKVPELLLVRLITIIANMSQSLDVHWLYSPGCPLKGERGTLA